MNTLLYTGIDGLNVTGVMPVDMYESLASMYPTRENAIFKLFLNDEFAGVTVQANHKTDNDKKIKEQGGYTAFINFHSFFCYRGDYLKLTNALGIKNPRVTRLDFAFDFNLPLPDFRKVKVFRLTKSMIVPGESITYGWGTRYKKLAVIWYDKLADIFASNGKKDYFLKHYQGIDSRKGVTRLELRLMREIWRQEEKKLFLSDVVKRSKDIKEILWNQVTKINNRDKRWIGSESEIANALEKEFDGKEREAQEVETPTTNINQLQITTIGLLYRIAYLKQNTREELLKAKDPGELIAILEETFSNLFQNPRVIAYIYKKLNNYTFSTKRLN